MAKKPTSKGPKSSANTSASQKQQAMSPNVNYLSNTAPIPQSNTTPVNPKKKTYEEELHELMSLRNRAKHHMLSKLNQTWIGGYVAETIQKKPHEMSFRNSLAHDVVDRNMGAAATFLWDYGRYKYKQHQINKRQNQQMATGASSQPNPVPQQSLSPNATLRPTVNYLNNGASQITMPNIPMLPSVSSAISASQGPSSPVNSQQQNSIIIQKLSSIDGKLEDISISQTRVENQVNRILNFVSNKDPKNNVKAADNKTAEDGEKNDGDFFTWIKNMFRGTPATTARGAGGARYRNPQTGRFERAPSNVRPGVGSRLLNGLGTTMAIVGSGVEAYNEYQDSGSAGRATSVGGGALAGIMAGGKLGAAIGAPFGGWGAVPGSIIGGTIGGLAGTRLGRGVYDSIAGLGSIGGNRPPPIFGGMFQPEASTTTPTERAMADIETRSEREANKNSTQNINNLSVTVRDAYSIEAGTITIKSPKIIFDGTVEFKGNAISVPGGQTQANTSPQTPSSQVPGSAVPQTPGLPGSGTGSGTGSGPSLQQLAPGQLPTPQRGRGIGGDRSRERAAAGQQRPILPGFNGNIGGGLFGPIPNNQGSISSPIPEQGQMGTAPGFRNNDLFRSIPVSPNLPPGSQNAASPEARRQLQSNTQPSAGASFSRGDITDDEYARIRGGANWALRNMPDPTSDAVRGNLTTIRSPSGQRFTVHKDAAADLQGFINELEGAGYRINPGSGGYNLRRNVNNPRQWSTHSYGTTLDINPTQNPNRRDGVLQTNLPSNISRMAARYNISWGGDWRSVKDAMHFEWMGPQNRPSNLIQPNDPNHPSRQQANGNATTPQVLSREQVAAAERTEAHERFRHHPNNPFGWRSETGGRQNQNQPQFQPQTSEEFARAAGLNPNDLPAGMRNNNPGNIIHTNRSNYPGLVGPSTNTDQGYRQSVFNSPRAGVAAMHGLLMQRFGQGRDTINKIIAERGGWTPGNYRAAANIARMAGIRPDEKIDLNDANIRRRVMQAIVRQEHGNAGRAYNSLIDEHITGPRQNNQILTPQNDGIGGDIRYQAQILGQANTTPSSRQSSALPESVTGDGAGLTAQGRANLAQTGADYIRQRREAQREDPARGTSQPPQPSGSITNDMESRRGRAFDNMGIPYRDRVSPDLLMQEAEREARRIDLIDREGPRGNAFNRVNIGAPITAPIPISRPADFGRENQRGRAFMNAGMSSTVLRDRSTDALVQRLNIEQQQRSLEFEAQRKHAEMMAQQRPGFVTGQAIRDGQRMNDEMMGVVGNQRQTHSSPVEAATEPPRTTAPSSGVPGVSGAATPSGTFAQELRSRSPGAIVEAPESNHIGLAHGVE